MLFCFPVLDLLLLWLFIVVVVVFVVSVLSVACCCWCCSVVVVGRLGCTPGLLEIPMSMVIYGCVCASRHAELVVFFECQPGVLDRLAGLHFENFRKALLELVRSSTSMPSNNNSLIRLCVSVCVCASLCACVCLCVWLFVCVCVSC